MPSSEFAVLEMEDGRALVPMSALTDSGDHKLFNSLGTLWSRRSGAEPLVLPNGVDTGGEVTTGAGNDAVSVAALSCYLSGVLVNVGAQSSVAVTRGTGADVSKISSITVTSAGAIAVVAGAAAPAFSETRGAVGGPPFVPVGSIELAQVRLASITAAPVTSAQIFSSPNQHREQRDYPLADILYGEGKVRFKQALMLSHTGGAAKGVFAQYSTPNFSELFNATDFVPAENSHTVNSRQTYSGTRASSRAQINQGSFSILTEDNVNDLVVKEKDQLLWFRFRQNRASLDAIFSQGKLGIARTFPSDDQTESACTISAESPSFVRRIV